MSEVTCNPKISRLIDSGVEGLLAKLIWDKYLTIKAIISTDGNHYRYRKIALSPPFARHLLVLCKISGQPWITHPHFLMNPSVTSQFDGSYGSPHTSNILSTASGFQKPMISKQNSCLLKRPCLDRRLSRTLGCGKKSSHDDVGQSADRRSDVRMVGLSP
jgi:hypothetical protein